MTHYLKVITDGLQPKTVGLAIKSDSIIISCYHFIAYSTGMLCLFGLVVWTGDHEVAGLTLAQYTTRVMTLG